MLYLQSKSYNWQFYCIHNKLNIYNIYAYFNIIKLKSQKKRGMTKIIPHTLIFLYYLTYNMIHKLILIFSYISNITIQLKYLNQIILYSKHGSLCSISYIKLLKNARYMILYSSLTDFHLFGNIPVKLTDSQLLKYL